MIDSVNYFNTHNHGNRIHGTGKTNSLGVVHQVNPAPAIIKADEVAYAIAMERNADNRRVKPKVSLAATPWG